MRTTAKTHSVSKSHAKEKTALDLLKADHKKVAEMFSEYEETHGTDKKKKLAEEICSALTVHAQVEEEIFYPAVKAALKDKELVPEAAVEHGVIKDLVTQIQSGEPDQEMYDAKVKVLSEYVKHHVKEEHEMFPKLKEQTSLDLVELGARMADRMQGLQVARH